MNRAHEDARAAASNAPELQRSLSSRHVTMISIGGIIGAGLFVASSTTILAAGPAIVLSYLAAGVLIMLVMRMLGEMAVARPDIHAFTDFPRLTLGHGAGFVSGWLYWYFWIVTVAVEAIAGAKILQEWFPLPQWELGLGLMAVMTGVNLLSTRSYGEFEFWFASIKVAAILAFIAVTLAYACGLVPSSGRPTFGNLTSHGGFMPHGFLAVLAGIATVFFSLTGAEITTVAAAESKEPARAVARLSTSVVGRVMVFYVGAVFCIVSVIPWNSVHQGESPFTLALNQVHIPGAGTAMSVIILTAVLSCLNSAFYVSSRVLFSLAAHGDAPQWLVQLNRRGVPSRSVLIGTVSGILGVLAASVAAQTVFAFLVNSSGALMLFVYLIMSWTQVRLRRARQREGGRSRPCRCGYFRGPATWPWPGWARCSSRWRSLRPCPGIYISVSSRCVSRALRIEFECSSGRSMSTNSDLLARRRAAVPAGVATAYPVFAQRACGAELWDVEGRRYIDFAGGIGVLNTGHQHEKVLEAVRRQLEAFTHTAFQVVAYEPYIALCERLNALAPFSGPAKTILFSTGAEAVENAVKIARAATRRPGVIAFSGAFHGRTAMTMALTGKVSPYKQQFGISPPGIYHLPFPTDDPGSIAATLGALETLFRSDLAPGDTAALILEPVLGEGGFLPAPHEMVKELRRVCDAHGIVLIADEVQSGFARTGQMFGIQGSGVEPDLVTVAKSLAGGFPLSGVIGRAALMDTVEPGGLGGTYAGNPVACAAALAVLDVIAAENLVERANVLGERARARLVTLRNQHQPARIASIRGPGAMIAFDVVTPAGLPDAARAKRITAAALQEGLILLTCGVHGNTIRLLFPLIIPDALFSEALGMLERAVTTGAS